MTVKFSSKNIVLMVFQVLILLLFTDVSVIFMDI